MLIESFVSDNFEFRNLVPKSENLDRYLSWMTSQENEFIESARKDFSMPELNEFVFEKNRASNAILIGVFSRKGNEHVGNVKFEPIEFQLKTAWMGILIGNSNFKGKGFAQEIITTSCDYLYNVHQIVEIYLGVNPKNIVAVNAYKKSGFVALSSHEKGGIVMLRRSF
jgi:ribosomal-protein-alanine N-acetyltransferase